MKPKSSTSSPDSVTIQPDATMATFTREEKCAEPYATMFRGQIRRVQRAAEQHGIFDAEALSMIDHTWGWIWTTIPWGRFQDCIDLMINNAGDAKYRVFDPDFARRLDEAGKQAGIYQSARELIDKLTAEREDEIVLAHIH